MTNTQNIRVCHFNPRTPCGVRRGIKDKNTTVLDISIHALLAECDLKYLPNTTSKELFQSTHSLRSATRAEEEIGYTIIISIHALLAECDSRGAPIKSI